MAKKVFTLKEIAEMREEAINQGLALINEKLETGKAYTPTELSVMSGGIFSAKGIGKSADIHCCWPGTGLYERYYKPRREVSLRPKRGASKKTKYTYQKCTEDGTVVKTWEDTEIEQTFYLERRKY